MVLMLALLTLAGFVFVDWRRTDPGGRGRPPRRVKTDREVPPCS